MKKKFSLSMLLTAVAMVLVIACGVKLQAKATDYYYNEDYNNGEAGMAVKYAITSYDDKTCQVIGCKSSATSITIVAYPVINGETYTCTSIAKNAFKGNKKLKTVKISASASKITTIPEGCFQNCTNLTSVYLDNTKLKSIGKKAFYNCKKLTTLSIKSTKITKSNIKTNAFKNVSNLKVYGKTKAYAKKLAKWIAARGGSVATYAKISS